MTTLNLLVFILGICVGSFLNVCIFRIPAGKSVMFPSSYCYSCGHKLGLLDLVPVLNYFYLRRKCRWCGAAFTWQYPLIEFITGLMFLLIWHRYGYSWETLTGWVFISILIIVTVIDLKHLIIPDKVTLTGLVLGLPLIALQSWASLKMGIVALLAASFLFWTIVVVSRGGMGGGDVKLAALMGLYLGPVNVSIALFLAFLAGGIVAIVLLVTKLKSRKDVIPFGPYLALGSLIAFLWGSNIWHWYLGLGGLN
jgi:leader peptidase (prepilin peptidase)/N-methyltransferase